MNASTGSIGLKEKDVNNLADSIKKSKTLMVASIKSLPSKQFQNIKKSIREHAEVKVAKKNIMMRALKAANVSGLDEYVGADCAFVISDLDAYELAGILAKKKTPVFAKAGQVAEDDIEVKDGPTDMVPGPAISELGALGLQVAVEDGKIAIKAPKVVITKGQTINENAASIFQKLNIMPFNVGLNIDVAYDVASKKIFTELKIDPEGYTEDLKQAAGKALGFAQKIVYICKETIGYFLAKGNAHGNALTKFDVEEEKDDNEKVEEKVEDTEENKTEGEKAPAEEEKKEEEKSEEAVEEKDDAQLNKPEESA
ncbi:MAG TPA: 50S ribosomal protein L10 [Candidatus Pacearchaeota archaeon]|nr:50S ribosomal protein L10 [Candidatus Pacearchaeota archaeon]